MTQTEMGRLVIICLTRVKAEIYALCSRARNFQLKGGESETNTKSRCVLRKKAKHCALRQNTEN